MKVSFEMGHLTKSTGTLLCPGPRTQVPAEFVRVDMGSEVVVRKATADDIERWKVAYAEFKAGAPPAAPNSVPHEPELEEPAGTPEPPAPEPKGFFHKRKK